MSFYGVKTLSCILVNPQHMHRRVTVVVLCVCVCVRSICLSAKLAALHTSLVCKSKVLCYKIPYGAPKV